MPTGCNPKTAPLDSRARRPYTERIKLFAYVDAPGIAIRTAIRKSTGTYRESGTEVLDGAAVPYSDWVIATEDVDSSGDILILAGCDLQPFEDQRCPVLLCHSPEALVGSSRKHPADPACDPDVRIDGNDMIARCYHHVKSDDGDKLRGWIESGVINGASVTFDKRTMKTRPPTAEERERGCNRVITGWSLHEWSVVAVPDNPKTRFLRAELGGNPQKSAYGELIRKSLEYKGADMAEENTESQVPEADADTHADTGEPMPQSAAVAQQVIEALHELAKGADAALAGCESETNEPVIRDAIGKCLMHAKDIHGQMEESYPGKVKLPDEFDETAKAFGAGDDEHEEKEEPEAELDADGKPVKKEEGDDDDAEEKSFRREAAKSFTAIQKALEAVIGHQGNTDRTIARILTKVRV